MTFSLKAMLFVVTVLSLWVGVLCTGNPIGYEMARYLTFACYCAAIIVGFDSRNKNFCLLWFGGVGISLTLSFQFLAIDYTTTWIADQILRAEEIPIRNVWMGTDPTQTDHWIALPDPKQYELLKSVIGSFIAVLIALGFGFLGYFVNRSTIAFSREREFQRLRHRGVRLPRQE